MSLYFAEAVSYRMILVGLIEKFRCCKQTPLSTFECMQDIMILNCADDVTGMLKQAEIWKEFGV